MSAPTVHAEGKLEREGARVWYRPLCRPRSGIIVYCRYLVTRLPASVTCKACKRAMVRA